MSTEEGTGKEQKTFKVLLHFTVDAVDIDEARDKAEAYVGRAFYEFLSGELEEICQKKEQ